MNLFAFFPSGHGEDSHFVMAPTEEAARQAVTDYRAAHPEIYPVRDFSAWPKDFTVSVLGPGQVASNPND